MDLIEFCFYIFLSFFGFVFIRRKKITAKYRLLSVLMILFFGVLLFFINAIDNGFGYSTPIDFKIINKSKSNIIAIGVLENNKYCGYTTYIYNFGKIELNNDSQKTIEADCYNNFIIFALDNKNNPIFIKKVNLSKDTIVKINAIEKLDKSELNIFEKYKTKLAEFRSNEQESKLYKIGIALFSFLILLLISKKK